MMGRRGLALTLAGMIGTGAVVGCGGKESASTGGNVAAAPEAKAAPTGIKELAEGLRRSDPTALASLWQSLNANPDAPKKALTEAEGAEWVDVLVALRGGYLKFEKPVARGTVVAATGKILEKFSVDPAPASWFAAITPVRDTVLSGVGDTDADVRATALGEIGKLWSWAPARTPLQFEERALAEWKGSLHAPVIRCLGESDPKVRVAAVACLGLNPLDKLAAPAVAFIDDSRSGDVRQQVMISFSRRSALLTEEMVLKRLHDTEPGIPELAEIVLKTRGLNRDQIFLGKLITNPKAELRASVIPMLRERSDIDPVVWLVQLSNDSDETVRTQAVQALGDQDSPESRQRLKEIASGDKSPAVREAAGKVFAKLTTAALPPLPGSSRLNPKAN